MVKLKARAEVRVPDGAGGMVKLTDRRFEQGSWPIKFDVPVGQASTWMRYLRAACENRKWSFGGLSQHEPKEQSGTLTIFPQAGKPPLTVVWERDRTGALSVRARCEPACELPVAELTQFLDDVTAGCVAGRTAHFFRWGCLEYDGLPWLGELWLDSSLRLGPPSTQYDRALSGPRAVIVTAMVGAVGNGDASNVFDKEMAELSAFLSVVMATEVDRPEQRQAWTWEIGEDGKTISSPRQIGYIEPKGPTAMPASGLSKAMPLYRVTRRQGHQPDGTEVELMLPTDVVALWAIFRALTDEQRSKFLQVAAKWQEAMRLWQDRDTLSFTLMVIACEALKPSGDQFRDHNVDDVVEALLGKPTADRIRQGPLRAHLVRSKHVHQGELRGSEFKLRTMLDFRDPTFDAARRDLFEIANAAIMEWLRLRGQFTLPVITRSMTTRRFLKQNAFAMTVVALIAGLVVGWFVRGFIN